MRYACPDHRGDLVAYLREHYGALGPHPWNASDLSSAQVGWTSAWYLRHDTLEAATGRIVDHQSTIALAQRTGTGERSSSERRRVSAESQQARALPRYFGRERGLTHYAFVSDQHTHFATRVIRTTVRDAT
ncbi:MAG: hypothetical protein QOD83_2542 [Solirubrobacteraceae bacterium]|jgi:TnpA family transposase|nr:hypothetical protein [Solirubrobacteraceae bacterium]